MKIIKLVFLIVTVLVFCSCTAKTQAPSDNDLEKVFAEADLRLLSQRVPSRDFSLPTLTGELQSLSGLKGKVVFLNFWATWCGPCRAEMPSMEALYNRYKNQGLEILAVNAMEGRADVQDFMKNNAFSFPVLLDEEGRAGNTYGVQALPTTFLIDRNGKIILRLVGSIDWDTENVNAAIEKLLGGK